MDPRDDRTFEEKRATARVQPFVVHCGVNDGPRHLSAYLTELSTGGARVTCPSPPPSPGTRLMLEVRFSGRLESVKLPARVAWAGPVGNEGEDASFGVSFDEISPEDRKVLDTVLGEFRRMAALLERPQRRTWTEGPEGEVPGDDWRGLDDDELLFRIAALAEGHDRDDDLMHVVDSERHFFIRQEAAKRIGNHERLKKHAGDRHIGQILARVMTRDEDEAYLLKLVQESRHLEVRKAAEAQLRRMYAARQQSGG
jgi:Tfp pilus assembly protein PilZ